MSITEVSTLDDLKKVMGDSAIKTVNLMADIENIGEVITFSNKVTFNGNNHKISFTLTGQNLVFLQPSTINDLTVKSQGTDSWTSTYATQVYNGQGYILNNVKFTGGNAGLLVNGATATVTNIDVSGNTFGGIEVSKGSLATNPSTLYIEGEVVNTTEAYSKPTVWTDGEGVDNKVIGGNFFENAEVKAGQVQYYLVEANSIKPEETEDIEEVIAEPEEEKGKETQNEENVESVETVSNDADVYGISTLSLEPDAEVEVTEETTTTTKKKSKRK